jgi:hypothetical protein
MNTVAPHANRFQRKTASPFAWSGVISNDRHSDFVKCVTVASFADERE